MVDVLGSISSGSSATMDLRLHSGNMPQAEAIKSTVDSLSDEQRKAASFTVTKDSVDISPEARQRLEAEGKLSSGMPGTSPLPGGQVTTGLRLRPAELSEEDQQRMKEAAEKYTETMRMFEEQKRLREAEKERMVYERADVSMQDMSGQLSATTSKGTNVQLQQGEDGASSLRFSGVNGSIDVALNPAENLHIKETENGLAVRTLGAEGPGSVRLLGFDGTMIDLADDSLFADMDGDDILVNMTLEDVEAGAGDDTIFNFKDGARIQGGAGNDTLIAGSAEGGSNLDADMGDGDDTVKAQTLKGGTVNLGAGNNTLQVDRVRNAAVHAGNGDNSLSVNVIDGTSTLEAGNGDNTVRLGGVMDKANVTLGEGNNTVSVNAVVDGSVTMGNGNNRLHVTYDGTRSVSQSSYTPSIYGIYGSINVGNGDNAVTFDHLSNLRLNLGDGDNALSGNALVHSVVNTGDGNNTVKSDQITGAAVNVGNGNNSVDTNTMLNMSVTTGDGNNSVHAAQGWGLKGRLGNGNNSLVLDKVDSSNRGMPKYGEHAVGTMADVEVGNGNNLVDIGKQGGTAPSSGDIQFKAGDGNNTLNVGTGFLTHSSIEVGDGNNTIDVSKTISYYGDIVAGNGNNTIKGGSGSSEMTVGDGNNTVELGNSYNSKATFGNGNNTVTGGGFGGSMTFGDGDNRVSGGFGIAMRFGDGDNTVTGGGSVVAGDGNNTLSGGMLHRVDLGNGNNSVNAFLLGTLKTGDGNNRVRVDVLMSHVGLGDGNNTVSIGHMDKGTSLVTGHGNNDLAVMRMVKSTLEAGDGDNSVVVGGMRNASSVSLGNGDNTATILTMQGKSQFSAGSGNNTVGIVEMRRGSKAYAEQGTLAVGVKDKSSSASTADGPAGPLSIRFEGVNSMQENRNKLQGLLSEARVGLGGSHVTDKLDVLRKALLSTEDGHTSLTLPKEAGNSTLNRTFTFEEARQTAEQIAITPEA